MDKINLLINLKYLCIGRLWLQCCGDHYHRQLSFLSHAARQTLVTDLTKATMHSKSLIRALNVLV